MSDKGTIAILTGGGDVPGLNPAIRAITIRALREGYRVLGIRRGWAGLVDYEREKGGDNKDNVQELSESIVNRAGRTGGTFLHTSRTRPSHLPRERVPQHMTGYDNTVNDITPEILKTLEHIGVDTLIPIGGDDTLSYGKRLHDEGVNVVAIPKTMDNDVYGTDYCIGFSTCVTRTIELTHSLRTSAGSHERFLIIEVFGRYAGFTALLPTMAGAADRCVIPEHAVDVAFVPINGNRPERRVAGNLDGREAAQLAFEIGARVAIPHHFEMFAFNTADPAELFVPQCERLGQPYRVLRAGESWRLSLSTL